MEPHLRAGAAVFNAGHHHAAHDAWEERWLELADGSRDERLLHGLIQYTAVVHHGRGGNWDGARGLAASGGDYLEGLPADHRGVDLPPVRRYLRRVAADPEHAERVRPPRLRVDGVAPTLADLEPAAAFVAAPVVAAALGYDVAAVRAGVDYAERDLAEGAEGSRFLTLVLDFLADAEHRRTVVRRLEALADRRRTREEDVDGLF